MVHQPINDDEAGKVLNQSGVFVIDFFAVWCGPCKVVAPQFKAMSEQYHGKAQFVKVDVDACPQAARHYEVDAMPTFVVQKDGAVVARVVGANVAALRMEVEKATQSS